MIDLDTVFDQFQRETNMAMYDRITLLVGHTPEILAVSDIESTQRKLHFRCSTKTRYAHLRCYESSWEHEKDSSTWDFTHRCCNRNINFPQRCCDHRFIIEATMEAS